MEQIATWLAPVATTIAALMTASNLGNRVTGTGFIVFTVGSLAWLALGIFTHQPNLVWQNVVLTLLNLFGVWRWLGRQARVEDGGKAAQRASEATPGEALFPASLLGRAKLLGRGGQELGALVDAMVGERSGRVDYLVVSSGGVGGVGEAFRRLSWGEVAVERQTVRAALDQAAFDRLQTLDRDAWPGR